MLSLSLWQTCDTRPRLTTRYRFISIKWETAYLLIGVKGIAMDGTGSVNAPVISSLLSSHFSFHASVWTMLFHTARLVNEVWYSSGLIHLAPGCKYEEFCLTLAELTVENSGGFCTTHSYQFLHWGFVTTEDNGCLYGHTFINKTHCASRLVFTALFT